MSNPMNSMIDDCRSQILVGNNEVFDRDNLDLFCDKKTEEFAGEAFAAMKEIVELNTHPKKESAFKRLQKYAKDTEILIKYMVLRESLFKSSKKQLDDLVHGNFENNGKRWTEKDDECLISLAAQNGSNVRGISLAMKRTPGAIKSRLTFLVGIKRVSANVCGRLVGYVNGEKFDGHNAGEYIPDRISPNQSIR